MEGQKTNASPADLIKFFTMLGETTSCQSFNFHIQRNIGEDGGRIFYSVYISFSESRKEEGEDNVSVQIIPHEIDKETKTFIASDIERKNGGKLTEEEKNLCRRLGIGEEYLIDEYDSANFLEKEETSEKMDK